MRLVPRQLQHVGMTGSVPYYGGRMSPAQAYAASHPAPRPPAPEPVPPPEPVEPPPPADPEQTAASLRALHAAGLLTDDELATLLHRVGS